MEEVFLKRNTDCVYFLASPFTCKKGVQCEFRHSELARLNPRDCWFWAHGSCLNPMCGFRHPPLEVHSEASAEAAAFFHHCPMPESVNNVPCYFYLNGYCSKGDRCSFLHDPDDSSAWKSKLATEVADAPELDTTTTASTEAGLPRPENYPSPKMAVKIGEKLQIQYKQHDRRLAKNGIVLPIALRQVPNHEYEEAAVTNFESPCPPENSTRVEPSFRSGGSSEDNFDDQSEQEEWWESSLGFDVLIDGRPEDTNYEDGHDNLQALDRNGKDLGCHNVECGYEDHIDYDLRIMPRYGIDESSIYLNDEHRFRGGEYSPGKSMDGRVNQIVSRDWEFLQVELPVSGRNGLDLRNHLRKQRMVFGHFKRHATKRQSFSYLTDRRRERVRRYRSSFLFRHGRLQSKIELQPVEKRIPIIAANQLGRSSISRHERSIRYYDVKKKPFTDRFPRKFSSKRERDAKDSTFTRHKTLSQIKEERSKSNDSGNLFWKTGHSSKNISREFEGPKPLSELLKDKHKVAAVGNGIINNSS
ncbi:hypothetical protein Nepgr_006341 [Nepenthes gracilis]|uniref:C3H1-type domain-containing protein n=1 Tax=Nepenthes gracilis TaxID=150966 RepID=A0AAD3XHH7_NEPGR|nr:hypothetical protein Nepgr_006341 [Nepenthes gracilis]